MAALAAALTAWCLLAPKQAWDTKPDVRANFLPRSARVELDGQPQSQGYLLLPINDPTRVVHVRVSAEGFETAEKDVTAGQVADREVLVALRPAGFQRPLVATDAAAMALAADALWKAGRADDAADYAEQSLRAGNTALANRVLGDVWRRRGNRDEAVKYYTMYLSLTDDPPDAPAIKAYLLQPRPGDLTVAP